MRVSPLFLATIAVLGFSLACAAGKHEGKDPGECADGVDNDDDGLHDCDDDDCDGSSECGVSEGRWGVDACASSTEGTGMSEGDVSNDLLFTDSEGGEVDLYQFCDRVLLVSFGAMWESNSQDEAGTLEGLYDELGDSGFVAVQALGENVDSSAPTAADLAGWESEYDTTFPVVSDDAFDGLHQFASGGTIGLPYRVLFDRGVVIVDSSGGVSDDDVRALVGE